MATGAVISSRSFGSFVISGKRYQIESTTAHDREPFISAVPKRHLFAARNQGNSASYGIIKVKRLMFLGETRMPFSYTFHSKSDEFHKRSMSKIKCFLSSDFMNNEWLRPRKLDSLSLSEHSSGMKVCADFKSEAYEMPELPNESVFQTPWWQQKLPKRWLIVLLCFSSFLLCNMDRVDMSIAILPMAKEFNWNPTTVGLIQSLFFWGYLLTQILGGIWADKIGGKIVLGFGVVWWSVATVLTPVAARIGLPFLLIMRAFMGIGEGVAMPSMNNILSKWIPVS